LSAKEILFLIIRENVLAVLMTIQLKSKQLDANFAGCLPSARLR